MYSHFLKPKEENLYELQNAMAQFIFQKFMVNRWYASSLTRIVSVLFYCYFKAPLLCSDNKVKSKDQY